MVDATLADLGGLLGASGGQPSQGALWDTLTNRGQWLAPESAADASAAPQLQDRGALWNGLTNYGQWLPPSEPSDAPMARTDAAVSAQPAPQAHGLLGHIAHGLHNIIGGLLGSPAPQPTSAAQTNQDQPQPHEGFASKAGHFLFGGGQSNPNDPLGRYRPGFVQEALGTVLSGGNPWLARDVLTERNYNQQVALPMQMRANLQAAQIAQAKNALILKAINDAGSQYGGQPQAAAGATQPDFSVSTTQGGAPQQGTSTPALPAAPQAPRMAPTPFNLKTLAALRFAGDPDASATWDMVKPHYAIDRTSGLQFDENGGGVTGFRAPRPTYINGIKVDPYADSAPSFLPEIQRGYEPTYDAQGNITGQTPLKGSLRAQHDTAEATARGDAAGKAAYETAEIPEVDQNGMPTGRTTVIRKSDLPSYQGALGVKQSPEDQKFGEGQTELLTNTVKTAADPVHQQQLDAQSQAARNVVQLASQVQTGKFTGNLSNLAQVMQSLGIKGNVADYANKTALLDQALDQQIGNAFQTYHNIRNEREFNMVRSTIGRVTDPADRLRYRAAVFAALTNQEKAYGQFASAYAADPRTPKTQAALDQAWKKADGGGSLFADPIWQNVTLFGRKAVVMSPDGKHGVFGYGTPMQQVFTVQH